MEFFPQFFSGTKGKQKINRTAKNQNSAQLFSIVETSFFSRKSPATRIAIPRNYFPFSRSSLKYYQQPRAHREKMAWWIRAKPREENYLHKGRIWKRTEKTQVLDVAVLRSKSALFWELFASTPSSSTASTSVTFTRETQSHKNHRRVLGAVHKRHVVYWNCKTRNRAMEFLAHLWFERNSEYQFRHLGH